MTVFILVFHRSSSTQDFLYSLVVSQVRVSDLNMMPIDFEFAFRNHHSVIKVQIQDNVVKIQKGETFTKTLDNEP